MSGDGGVTIRQAGADDLDAVSALFLACWRRSYRGVLPDRVVRLYDEAGARTLWQRSLGDGPSGREVVVAERADGTVVGVVTVGEDPDRPGDGHIFSLYVHPDVQGRGIGARLVSVAVDRLEASGYTEASLWVFAANARAGAFYERLGWRHDGTRRVEPRYGEPESRLIRHLRSGARAGANPLQDR